MDFIWILFVIFAIISKMMKKAQISNAKSDAEEKPREFSEWDHNWRNILQQMAGQNQLESKISSEVDASFYDPSWADVSEETDIQEPKSSREGICRPQFHLAPSQEGLCIENQYDSLEGVSLEGSFVPGSIGHSAHKETEGIKDKIDRRKNEIQSMALSDASSLEEEPTHSKRELWVERMIWKEVLSPPVALRGRHGAR